MFDSQPLGHVICSNYIDYNLIILIFKEDVLINFNPPHPPVPIVVTPSAPRMGTYLMDAPVLAKATRKIFDPNVAVFEN